MVTSAIDPNLAVIQHGGHYYPFVYFDRCCRGAKSTYKIIVGRSAKITGPYLDKDGKAMLGCGGNLLLDGNGRWHVTGRPFLQISTIAWVDGWPRVGTPAPAAKEKVQ